MLARDRTRLRQASDRLSSALCGAWSRCPPYQLIELTSAQASRSARSVDGLPRIGQSTTDRRVLSNLRSLIAFFWNTQYYIVFGPVSTNKNTAEAEVQITTYRCIGMEMFHMISCTSSYFV